MNMKATTLTIALTATALIGAAFLYNQSVNNSSNAPTVASAGTSSPPVPWPVPAPNSTGATNSNDVVKDTTNENSVVIPPPPVAAPGTAAGITGTPATAQQLNVSPGTYVVEPNGEVIKTAQIPMAPMTPTYAPVPAPHNTRVVQRVTVHKRYKHKTGKVHVTKAVKHAVLFSAKLPFKLRP